MSEIPHKKNLPVGQSGTKVGHGSLTFLSVKEAAYRLQVSSKTVVRWCESGQLMSLPHAYGKKKTYQVLSHSVDYMATHLENLKLQKSRTKPTASKMKGGLDEWIKPWESAMAMGSLNGKPYSPKTIALYRIYLGQFLGKSNEISVSAVKKALMSIKPEQCAKRMRLYDSVLCFARFLVKEGVLEEDKLIPLKPLKPKRHLPPKRLTVTELELEQLFEAGVTTLDKVLVRLLATTGIRASECTDLTLADIDLAHGVLRVRLGKGNKSRAVGLSDPVIQLLSLYLETERPDSPFSNAFLNRLGEPMDRHGLRQRIERIGKAAGVEVNPHALRRAFVTVNANKGRPLQMLQRACGHSDIKTTMSYCRTSEQEVIDAMKGW